MSNLLCSQEDHNPRAAAALFQAAIDGDFSQAQKIVVSFPEAVHARCKWRKTPLHYAASHGHLSIVRLLMAHGAETYSLDYFTVPTPFHDAAAAGQLNVVQYFVENGIDVNIRNCVQTTPLHMASKNGHLPVVEYLVKHGAETNTRNLGESTPFNEAVSAGQLSVVQFFVDNGFDVNTRNSIQTTPLHDASARGHPSVVEYLVKHSADVNTCNQTHNTPLHIACWNSLFNVVKALVLNGAELNPQNCHQKTPLHNAARHGSYEIVRFLVEHGADVNALDKNHQTPLYDAADSAMKSHKEDYDRVIRFLACKRTDLDVRDEDEAHDTLLCVIILHCEAAIVKFLIERYVYIGERDARTLAVFYAQESPQWLIDRRQKLSEALDQRLIPALRDLLMEFVLEKDDHLSITRES